MVTIVLDSGAILETEIAGWEQTRVVDCLNRGEFVVMSSAGYWRASFDYRTDALDFARSEDKVLSPTGAIVSIVAVARRN